MENQVKSLFIVISLVAYTLSQCPPEEDILPCTCFGDVENLLLNCGNVISEDQIENACRADFGRNDLKTFEIIGNKDLTGLSRNLFGNLSFESHSLGLSNIALIDESVFENSFDTLIYISYTGLQMSEDGFPFEVLSKLTKLENIQFTYNENLKYLPKISSSTLSYVDITTNGIETLADFCFKECPSLSILLLNDNLIREIKTSSFIGATFLYEINLENNNIVTLSQGSFTGLPYLKTLEMNGNNIVNIENAAFNELPALEVLNIEYNQLSKFSSAMFFEVPSINHLDLSYGRINFMTPYSFEGFSSPYVYFDLSRNNVTTLEENTFTGLSQAYIAMDNNNIRYVKYNAFKGISDSNIWLDVNKITTLDSDVFKPLIIANNTVFLDDNPLECGCDVAWIYDTPDLLNMIQINPCCTDGRYMKYLDSSDFEEC